MTRPSEDGELKRSKNDTILRYRSPARTWNEALPLGNGRIGAMVFGRPSSERIALNEGSLWSGGPRDWDNPAARALLPEARAAVLEGRYKDADRLSLGMQGPFTQAFMPLGDLSIELAGAKGAGSYRRELDLDTATASVYYESGGIAYSRRAFASYPDRVLVIRLTSSRKGGLSFRLGLAGRLRADSSLAGAVPPGGAPDLVLRGVAPSNAEPDYRGDLPEPLRYDEGDGRGMAFEARLRLLAEGGRIATDAGESGGGAGLGLERGDAATIIISAATGFEGFRRRPRGDPSPLNEDLLARAASLGHEALLERHLEDYRALFRRVSLRLSRPLPPSGDAVAAETGSRDADERVRSFALDEDPGLAALLFNYGRYLLIASSRPGGQPANLQGIWNESTRPPWSSNFTLNINLEMNYWPAECCNLAECHVPLLEFVRDLASNGERTAATNYGARGWVAHHNSDLWRQSAPVGDFGGVDPIWSFWPMGGIWLCAHLWDHYEYGGDSGYLRDFAYPLMKGAAEFCLDWLVEDGKGGLTTAPSTSPELRFVEPASDGSAALGPGATMDRALIHDLLADCERAARALGLDVEFADRLAETRARLRPYASGSRGQLLEWSEDFVESEVRHRHLSHLYGLYPGRSIDPAAMPEIAAAARRSLELRGDASTGWSLGWKIALWSALGEGDRAYGVVRLLLRPADLTKAEGEGGGLYPNLFDAHPPFQIDGNFAFASGLAGMLLQCRGGELRLLPSLPSAWPEGEARGLRGRGGFEIGIKWEKGELAVATVLSRLGGTCRLRASRPLALERDGAPGPAAVLSFETERDGLYRVLPA